MDECLRITESPREGVPDALAETPLTTLAWRALRNEHAGKKREKQTAEAEQEQYERALAEIAHQSVRLRQMARNLAAGKANADAATAQFLNAIADAVQAAYQAVGITLLSPEGDPYTDDLMEVMENVARRPDPDAAAPRVVEVIEPAILFRGRLLRMGKAVIGIPAPRGDSADSGVTPAEGGG